MTTTRDSLRQQILLLPVWDTHTHLIPGRLPAQTFWDVAHYFWYRRELAAAGYSANADELDEAERIQAFLPAFHATRNTCWSWAVRQMLRDLWDLKITDAGSIHAAHAAMAETAARDGWPAEVCRRIGVKRIVVNNADHAPFHRLPGAACVVPRIEALLRDWGAQIAAARARTDEVADEIAGTVADFAAAGHHGLMVSLGTFAHRTAGADTLAETGNRPDGLATFCLHAICRALEAHGMFFQLFLGMEGDWAPGVTTAHNDPRRILNLYGLFEKYSCPFELVLASEINNLDVVQAARIFPHVRAGGLWWFNFRPSTYRDVMQFRLEALPPGKCSLIASDARCIEWCYAKILTVKRLLADFLYDQIQLDWIDEDTALFVAREWLHDAPARVFDGRLRNRT